MCELNTHSHHVCEGSMENMKRILGFKGRDTSGIQIGSDCVFFLPINCTVDSNGGKSATRLPFSLIQVGVLPAMSGTLRCCCSSNGLNTFLLNCAASWLRPKCPDAYMRYQAWRMPKATNPRAQNTLNINVLKNNEKKSGYDLLATNLKRQIC